MLLPWFDNVWIVPSLLVSWLILSVGSARCDTSPPHHPFSLATSGLSSHHSPSDFNRIMTTRIESSLALQSDSLWDFTQAFFSPFEWNRSSWGTVLYFVWSLQDNSLLLNPSSAQLIFFSIQHIFTYFKEAAQTVQSLLRRCLNSRF